MHVSQLHAEKLLVEISSAERGWEWAGRGGIAFFKKINIFIGIFNEHLLLKKTHISNK